MKHELIFEAKHMRKEFGPTIALKDVDFQIRRGEIRGLVGENGSGKSTIMSIAAGMQRATKGEMFYKGELWDPKSMVEAQNKGISMILQEANTIPHVSVAQNLFAGREKEFSLAGIININKMFKAANKLLKEFGIHNIYGKDLIDELTYEDRKLIEIVRCLTNETEILVVDETTTALSQNGREALYSIINEMTKKRNKSVVFISHDMDEILEQCDVVTVLRDGDIIGHLNKTEMKAHDAIKKMRYMMVGREIGEKYYREDFLPSSKNEVALELKNVSFGQVKDISLKVHKGEIVGFGGLSGSGMREVGRAAYGLEKLEAGKVVCNGAEIHNSLQAIENGIGYISKNRDREALILEGSIQDNIVLPSLSSLSNKLFINPLKEKRLSNEQIKAFEIKCNSGEDWVATLSGGNKQKVSFAKWMAKDSDVIIMDCPTRGVDVGVKQSMYRIIEEMKNQGKAIIMISEELSELIGMADRIIIMKNYKISKEFLRSEDLKQTDIIEYMI